MTSVNTELPAPARSTTEAVVARVGDFEIGEMKMRKVGERRVVVIRTTSGFHALDNACPHQGYGLATGALDGELLTCQWHNWKFRVSDGTCVIGEESVPCHRVEVRGDDIVVSVTEPSAEEQLRALWPSLRRAVERDYRGQIARDTARLLRVGARPEEILTIGLEHGISRAEWGLGHDMAVSADLLTLSDRLSGLERTLPLAQALSGLAESQRDRPVRDLPAPIPQAGLEIGTRGEHAFVQAVEAEDEARAVGLVRALIASGSEESRGEILREARRWLLAAVSRHHYDYGHGAIFVQKAFELVDRMPHLAELLLSHLARTLVFGTREDTLPYMRKAMRTIDAADAKALAASIAAPEWSDDGDVLLELLLDAPEPPITQLVQAALDGAGIEGVLDVVALAASHRMLRFDLAIELDRAEPFGWLDITHALTYANAARWAWRCEPGPATARLALLTAFLAWDSGRAERRRGTVHSPLPPAQPGNIVQAVIERRGDDAVAAALAGPADRVADQLEAASMEDTAGSFIVMAHLVKTAVAARAEAEATGSLIPLAAVARFQASARAERFVTVGAREAIDFVRTGKPPQR